MRQIIFGCLLFLFAYSSFAQVVDPTNSIIIYPNPPSLNAQQPGFISIEQRTASGTIVPLNLSQCNPKVPYTLDVVTGPPGGFPSLNPAGFQCFYDQNVSYKTSFYITVAGDYELQALYNTAIVNNSYGFLTVYPGAFSAQESTMEGIGLHEAFAGVPSYFNITAKDQYQNRITNCSSVNVALFNISIYQANSGIEENAQFSDCENGVFRFFYVVNITGNWILRAQYLGSPINGSIVNVNPGPPDGPNCIVGYPPTNLTAGEESTFNFTCTDQYDNLITYCDNDYLIRWIVEVVSPSNTTVATFVSCNNETGTQTYTYTLTKADSYVSNVYFVESTNQIPSFNQLVVPGERDPNNTQAIGNGVTDTNQNIAGNLTFFTLSGADQYGNPIPNCITDGEWAFIFTPDTGVSQPETPSCIGTDLSTNYTTTVTGDYNLIITYNGLQINNGNSYHPVFYSNALDPTRAVVNGTGTTNATAGLIASVSITGQDIYGNDFNNCPVFSGPEYFSQWNVQLVLNSNNEIIVTGNITSCVSSFGVSSYTAVYLATVAGEYTLTISIAGVPITPTFTVTVVPGSLDVMHAVAQGLGFNSPISSQFNSTVTAGDEESFQIVQYDQYENQITQCPEELVWTATFISESNVFHNFTSGLKDCNQTTGIYTLKFNIKRPTSFYTITVTTDYSTPFPLYFVPEAINNTGAITLQASTFSALQSSFGVDGPGSVGQPFNVTAFAYDKFHNPYNYPTPPLIFTFTAELLNDKTTKYSGNLSYSTDNVYMGTFIPQKTGVFLVNVSYINENGTSVKIAPIVETTSALYGSFDPALALLFGPAFTSPTMAGTNGTFYLSATNEYNFSIPVSGLDNNSFVVNFIPQNTSQNAAAVNLSVNTQENEMAVVFTFNATTATNYKVTVQYNGSLVSNPGNSIITVIPGPLNPNSLVVTILSGPVDAQGNFSVSGQDFYKNPVIPSSVNATLSPVCANATADCDQIDGNDLICNYTAYYGGSYCIDVEYQQQIIPSTATIEIVGGIACNNNCNNQGYCFENSEGGMSCNCFQGFTGDDCSDKVSSKYMNLWLAIGLIIGLSIVLFIIGIGIGCFVGRK